ncbi:MAG: sel1 repeat family protein [Thermoguttaceae bacterium]|nr:sel1 repeat family protein [Thermoguttaceae bacterium]
MGRGTFRSRQETLKAAERGDVDAMLEMYRFVQDREAVEWYRRAAEAGSSEGAFWVAVCYEQGRGVDVDAVMAFEWYKRSAEMGNLRGMSELGLLYGEGRGVERDDAKAFELLHKAYDRGLPDFCAVLAGYYAEGRGVKQDLTKAFELYCKWNGDEPEPYLEVARCYRFGRGVEADEKQAIYWYDYAGRYGSNEAFRELVEWREKMSDDGLTKEEKEKIEFARRHCLQDDEDD